MVKKLITIALLTTSMGAIASPAKCFFNWAQHQGADLSKRTSIMPQWGKDGLLQWNKQGPTIGYRLTVTANNPNAEKLAHAGPWDCHCTAWPVFPLPIYKDQPMHINGICGRW